MKVAPSPLRYVVVSKGQLALMPKLTSASTYPGQWLKLPSLGINLLVKGIVVVGRVGIRSLRPLNVVLVSKDLRLLVNGRSQGATQAYGDKQRRKMHD